MACAAPHARKPDGSGMPPARPDASGQVRDQSQHERQHERRHEIKRGVLHHVVGFPAEAMLAQAEAMEWYDFAAPALEAGLPEEQRTTCTFTTRIAARFSGVHLHLRAALDQHTRIDAREQDTTWSCIYIRLLAAGEAVWLPQGSTVCCSCSIDVRGECSHYTLDVSAAPPGEPLAAITSFAWSGDG